jgi:hypothetical protein
MDLCQTKIPKKLKDNVCIRPGMGGNAEMINHVIGTEVACAKKFDKHEVYFYETMNKYKNQKTIKSLIPFLPKYYGTCIQDNVYFVMENLVKNKKTKFMDLKVGYKSSLLRESDWIKYTRHYFIDHLFSISSSYGFRLEGFNFPIEKKRPTGKTQLVGNKKYKRYVYHPLDIFEAFYDSKENSKEKSVKRTIEQIEKMVSNFARPNLRIIKTHLNINEVSPRELTNKSNLVGIGFIGMSLFIVKDPHRLPIVKLIDFAHPTIITSKSTKKEMRLALEEAENFLRGLEGVLKMLRRFEEDIR